ncbi:MAG: sulfite oxidase heme-binding subunit YedZ [Anaerolineae bacterium]
MRRPKLAWLHLISHAGALTPLALTVWDYVQQDLTVNPIQEITLRSGQYALTLLLLSLAVTPAITLFGLKWLLPLRRRLGLYTFLYASLHFLTFVGLDYGFDWELIQEAIFEKRYALVGFSAFVILLALALTSSKKWMKRLGKNWKRLHRLVYPAGLLVIVHFVWLVKADIGRPLMYGAVLGVLLVLRWPAIRRWVAGVRAHRRQTRPVPPLAKRA